MTWLCIYIYIWSDYIHFVLHSMYMYIHLHVHICHGIQKNKHNRTRNIMYSSWYGLLCHPLGAHASAWQKARPWTPSLAELGSNWWRLSSVQGSPLLVRNIPIIMVWKDPYQFVYECYIYYTFISYHIVSSCFIPIRRLNPLKNSFHKQGLGHFSPFFNDCLSNGPLTICEPFQVERYFKLNQREQKNKSSKNNTPKVARRKDYKLHFVGT